MLFIIIYNNINPDQNKISLLNSKTEDYPVEIMKKTLEKIDKNGNEYAVQEAFIEFANLYNSFKQDSWQRYALKEETMYQSINNVYTNYNLDINKYLENIKCYELNTNAEITKELYNVSKIKYNEYVNSLKSNDWKQFIYLKIKNLEERKNTQNLLEDEIKEINFEIEVYKLRLDNNINFGYDISNQYLEQYKSNYYLMESLKNNAYNESVNFFTKNYNEYVSNMKLCKYAIENNIKQDISGERNLIYDNKVDARISFIRTFEHFDIIIVIIAIYIATTIVTEETNKRTIKSLLTKPHKRSTILISKILACIITIIISMIVIIIIQYLVGGIIWGFDSYELGYIGYNYNKLDHIVFYSDIKEIFVMNIFNYIILVAITKLPMYIMIILFCIFLGIINNHTSMSMILTLIIFLISSIVLTEWSKVEALSSITRFFVTMNWDFSKYLFGQVSDISGVTFWSSIKIYALHLIIIMFVSIRCFNKKEINNV